MGCRGNTERETYVPGFGIHQLEKKAFRELGKKWEILNEGRGGIGPRDLDAPCLSFNAS